jgi:hypothetical protein
MPTLRRPHADARREPHPDVSSAQRVRCRPGRSWFVDRDKAVSDQATRPWPTPPAGVNTSDRDDRSASARFCADAALTGGSWFSYHRSRRSRNQGTGSARRPAGVNTSDRAERCLSCGSWFAYHPRSRWSRCQDLRWRASFRRSWFANHRMRWLANQDLSGRGSWRMQIRPSWAFDRTNRLVAHGLVNLGAVAAGSGTVTAGSGDNGTKIPVDWEARG